MSNKFMKQQVLIGGEWRGEGELPITDPASNEQIGKVPNCGRAETKQAVEAAHEAFQTFSKSTANERAELLKKMANIMLENQQELANLLTLEMGKPLAESMGEINMSAQYITWFAEEARRIYGDIVPSPWSNRRILVRREPVGVVGAITPWNFPSSMLARKLGAAIAAGCTCVVKPAPETPFSGLAWGLVGEMAGVPKGVINIITGDAEQIGKELCENELVKKITFTGSTKVGKILLQQCASSVKKVSMELGGNAPFIVFESADLEKAVEGAMGAKYRNSGQTCVCTNRFYVHENLYDEFVKGLAKKASQLKVANGFDEGAQQGPLITETAAEKIESFISDAKQHGGEIICGGERHELGGTFFQPTVIANANEKMKATTIEIFGPIAFVYKFKNEDEVIKQANNTNYGLACYIFTQDLSQTFRAMESLEYGLVGINEGVITTVEAPFGGVKHSGLGSEGGKHGVDEYLNTKYVCLGGLEIIVG